MRRCAVFFLTLFFLFCIQYSVFSIPARAEGEFIVDSAVTYDIETNGTARVTHTVTLENVLATLYAQSYSFSLSNLKPQNIKASQNGQDLPLSISDDAETIQLKIDFPDALVGKGKKRQFSVAFDIDGLAVRTGEVWEISIPKLSKPENYRNYSLTLSVPTSFGMQSYITPKPFNRYSEGEKQILDFTKEQISSSPVSAGFGEFQVFAFVLNYHLENPLSKKAETEIPLPPDTSFQKVYYNYVNPKPNAIRIDQDGNWLARYELSPRQRLDIQATGNVQLYAKERNNYEYTTGESGQNLAPTEVWQSDDEVIKQVAGSLKTPKEIYDYVVAKLNYDYDRVKPNIERLGAKKALENPDSAICMEFTDLFIALARAAGIPAREINGFAYTENTKIQPLSLVADVLHSWPEYWDAQRQVWVSVDPTWGKTTGGIDYFSKLDLRHLTFVIHGSDPYKPYPPGSYKLGGNPQKDVYVNFSKLPEKRQSEVKIRAAIARQIPFFDTKISFELANEGPIAIYNNTPTVYLDNLPVILDPVKTLLPFNKYTFDYYLPFRFLGRGTPDSIFVRFALAELAVPGFKSDMIFSSLITSLSAICLPLVGLLVYFRRKNLVFFVKNLKAKLPRLRR